MQLTFHTITNKENLLIDPVHPPETNTKHLGPAQFAEDPETFVLASLSACEETSFEPLLDIEEAAGLLRMN